MPKGILPDTGTEQRKVTIWDEDVGEGRTVMLSVSASRFWRWIGTRIPALAYTTAPADTSSYQRPLCEAKDDLLAELAKDQPSVPRDILEDCVSWIDTIMRRRGDRAIEDDAQARRAEFKVAEDDDEQAAAVRRMLGV